MSAMLSIPLGTGLCGHWINFSLYQQLFCVRAITTNESKCLVSTNLFVIHCQVLSSNNKFATYTETLCIFYLMHILGMPEYCMDVRLFVMTLTRLAQHTE